MKKTILSSLCLVFGLSSLCLAQDLEANKSLHQRLFNEIWNQKALNVIEEIYSPDIVSHPYSHQYPDIKGYEGIRKVFTERFEGFPDIQHTIDDQVAEGDMVVSRVTTRGTHLGVYGGIPATGKEVVQTAILWSRVADGKIVESWSNADDVGGMEQLGLMPASRTDYNWGYPRQTGNGNPQDLAYNKSLQTRVFTEVWNQGRLEVIDELFFPNYTGTNPSSGGTAYFKQFVMANLTAFPDMQFTVLDQIAEQDMVVTRWVSVGTHQGVFMGLKPTYRNVTMTGISMVRIDDGKIAQNWERMDMLGVVRTLTATSVEDWEVQN